MGKRQSTHRLLETFHRSYQLVMAHAGQNADMLLRQAADVLVASSCWHAVAANTEATQLVCFRLAARMGPLPTKTYTIDVGIGRIAYSAVWFNPNVRWTFERRPHALWTDILRPSSSTTGSHSAKVLSLSFTRWRLSLDPTQLRPRGRIRGNSDARDFACGPLSGSADAQRMELAFANPHLELNLRARSHGRKGSERAWARCHHRTRTARSWASFWRRRRVAYVRVRERRRPQARRCVHP